MMPELCYNGATYYVGGYMARFSLRIGDDLLDWLNRCSKIRHHSINTQILVILEEYRVKLGEISQKDVDESMRVHHQDKEQKGSR